MITPATNSTLKQSQQFQSVSFGIKHEGLAHIFNVLRNHVYSDKILAVVREYSANSLDAHVESGNQDRPIEVTLPSHLNLAFKVRDYGLGLSEDQVRNIYANYGESTKRGTNEQIGQLGLGSKSAFAYGDNFLIRSFQNGIVTLYNAFIDPSQIGQIAKLHSESTTEEDGVEIEVPVKSNDIDIFRQKAQGLFKYFKIRPIVKGNKEFVLSDDSLIYSGGCFKLTQSVGQSVFVKNAYGAVALMGNIAYPIDPSAINWGEDSGLRTIFQRSIVVDFEIGDLEVSASREALQYTPHTQKNLIAKAKQIKDECLAEVESKMKKGSSMFEAKKLYSSIFDFYSEYSLGFLRGILNKNDLVFNGRPLTNSIWSVISIQDGVREIYATVTEFEKRRSRSGSEKVKGLGRNSIPAAEHSVYVIKDIKSNILNRIAPLCEMENNHLGRVFKKVYLIEPGAGYDQWVKEAQFDAPTIKLSDLPKVSLKDLGYIKKRPIGASAVNKKHSESVFKPLFGKGYTQAKSEHFESTEVDFEAGGIWFEIDRFVPVDTRCHGINNYINFIKFACDFLELDHTKVIAVKTKDSNKFKTSDKWKTVAKWFSENVEKYIADNKIEQKYADQSEYFEAEKIDYGEYFNRITCLLDGVNDKSKEMATLGKHMIEMRHKEFDEVKQKIDKICNWTKIPLKSCKPSHDLSSEWEIVKSKYPLYKMIDGCSLNDWRFNSETKQNVINYINMIDSTAAR